MQWTKPKFEEVCLAMEVTAYVNTDDSLSVVGETTTDLAVSSRSAERTAETVCAN